MPDINDLFPPDKQLKEITNQIRGLTRENAPERLAKIACAKCRYPGQYYLFDRGPHLGILCLRCNSEHPFMRLGVMWLKKEVQA